MRNTISAILACILLLLLYGCTYNIPAIDKLSQGNMTVAHFSNLGSLLCQPLDDPKPCFCMFCQNASGWNSPNPLKNFWLSVFYDTTLYQGNCSFAKCNLTDFVSEISNTGDNLQTRTLMVGFGPSFVSTDSANRYCNYSLQLATKWMVGTQLEAPQIPKATKAKCWLDENTIPLYLYYTEGKNIDAGRTGDIAQEMDGAGPVMIATEVGLNSSNNMQIQQVKDQIDAIKSNCEHCMVVLSVNGNDSQRKEALKKIFLDSSTPSGYSDYYDKTDIVGFGFLANDYPTCSPADVVGENFIFSRFVLRNYSKPTIWLYAGAARGNNSAHSCIWDDEKVHNFYQTIFATSQPMASSGVIGVSFYEFADFSGPIPCNSSLKGCGNGLVGYNGLQKHPDMNTWSSSCQYFGTEQQRSPLIFSRNGFGSVCDPPQLMNNRMFRSASMEFNSQQGLSYTNVPMCTKTRFLKCGEICVSDQPLIDSFIFDQTGHTFGAGHCDRYAAIDEGADEREISSLFFRSVVEQESGFEPFAVSCSPNACAGFHLRAPDICTMLGYPPDCAKVPGAYWNDPGNPYHDCPSDPNINGNTTVCAFGIAQCIEYPGKYYVDNSLPIPLAIKNCGSRGDGTDYDPLNPTDSACCGLNKMKIFIAGASQWVDANWVQLTHCSDGIRDDKGWVAHYLAANSYLGTAGNGDPSSPVNRAALLAEFITQRDDPSDCAAGTEHNFINFIRNYVPGESNYGAKVLSRYIDAIGKCESDCPGIASPS